MKLDLDQLNFDRCEDEPIHIPELIQGYGYLFALEEQSGEVKIVSDNISTLLQQHEDILGKNFFELLDMDEEDWQFIQETYERARTRQTRLPLQVVFRNEVLIAGNPQDFYAVLYSSGSYQVLEIEPATKFRQTYSAKHYIKLYSMNVAPKFKTFKSLETMAREIVETIRYISEMERVVLYRFNEDGTGKVIAETKHDDLDSYLDLYYPASDIPQQARELYKINWVRLVPDVDLPSARLIPTVEDSDREPLDLTHSILRSLSPIHQQYVRNQGLKASMSFSLVTHNQLWGMISCHSREPRYIEQNVRLECESLCQLFSWHLYAKEEEIYFEKQQNLERAINQMLEKTSLDNSAVKVFQENEAEVLDLMDADGFMFFSKPQNITLGTIPEAQILPELIRLMNQQEGEPFYSAKITDEISDEAALNGIKGVLLLPLFEQKNYFTAWFRTERQEKMKWAGVPQEKSAVGSKRERLTPRTSFKIHEQVITGKSKDWDQNDVDMAGRFNRVFMAHALDTQEQMSNNLSELEENDRYKNEFLATLAHELRNPLSPLATGLSLLEKGPLPAQQTKVVNTMKRQVNHMTQMIEDLMDISRITRGKIRLEKEQLTAQAVVQNAVEVCAELIDDKRHTLSLDLPEDPLWVYGDEMRLTQILTNLLNNAAKYTDPGGEIQVAVHQQEDAVCFRVVDNGIGIPPEQIDLIFTMFTQMDAFANRSKGGLGIGLPLVKRLVNLHDGEIFAKSVGADQGSAFEVLLPLAASLDKESAGDVPTSSDAQETGTKLLIVDDNEDNVLMFELLLESLGYEIRTASNGTEAIAVFREFQPNIALLDIGLPDINGYELCQHLRSLPEGKNTVFFSQSGWGDEKAFQTARESGFAAHFVKPVDHDVLIKALQEGSRRLRRA
ncbi:ATP-binding protein [Crocosphaera chwakensis]|uniref:histidine kinase n=1 Tax=Crocosphaera chwakensis CCY0110 TaxID=391612 RepID=A3IHL2_9CHRO|nr:ATP-binding protein [Crocosphaera chwakensis]EAZ93294.1 bacteriophytochrome histidine kinase [Crocosphaera chwakensis CCY0110]